MNGYRFIQLVKLVSKEEKLPLPKAVPIVAQRYSDSFILTRAGQKWISSDL